MKKSALILMASMVFIACGQNTNSSGGQSSSGDGAAGVAPAPGTGSGGNETGREGEPNVVDSAAQDTANDASIKPAPKNETTPPEVTKPKH